MTPTGGVGAVVLSMGEPFVGRAVASLRAQTLPIAPIVTIEHVSPFYRALNAGAAQMTAPWFVQLDADMILDPGCAATLLARVTSDTGIVVGELRDPLSDRVVGVKLFRTACFGRLQVRDSIGNETDFVAGVARAGWRTTYVEDVAGDGSVTRPALGSHEPAYTPEYTYRKLLVEGRKLRHRGARHGLYYRMTQLEESAHRLAPLAQMGLGHGFFMRSDRDELRPAGPDPDAARLAALLEGGGGAPGLAARLLPVERYARLGDVFRDYVEAGQTIARGGAGHTLRTLIAALPVRRQPRPLVAKVALGHGLAMDDDDRGALAEDTAAFRRFMLFGLGSAARWRDHAAVSIARLARFGRPRKTEVPW